MRAGQRDLDIVLFGVTGYVGRLIAAYLADLSGSEAAGVRVGLAGRSPERLAAVRKSLGRRAETWPLIVAELSDVDALAAMACNTRVLVNAVGPYSRYGLPVVAACTEAGTDYVDLTGEVPFVRQSIDRCHQKAVETGARIVHSCGFDSIPSDLAVYALHREVASAGAGELGETMLVLRNYSGGYAGGSIATMLDLMRLASSDPAVRPLLEDPYSLSPDRSGEPDLGPQPDLPLRPGADISEELAGQWLGGYVMALYNTRCVRRTNALLGWIYGRALRYSESIAMGSLPVSPFVAAMYNVAITGASRFGGEYLKLVPDAMLDRFTPAPGTGHDEGLRGGWRVQTFTTTTTGRRFVADMSQRGDPGYTATAALAGQSALGLVLDRDRLPDTSGVLTPAAAMGDVLLQRLPGTGVRLDISERSLAQGR
jgi:short subunit dehydrogenase-like uncharacterized protein